MSSEWGWCSKEDWVLLYCKNCDRLEFWYYANIPDYCICHLLESKGFSKVTRGQHVLTRDPAKLSWYKEVFDQYGYEGLRNYLEAQNEKEDNTEDRP